MLRIFLFKSNFEKKIMILTFLYKYVFIHIYRCTYMYVICMYIFIHIYIYEWSMAIRQRWYGGYIRFHRKYSSAAVWLFSVNISDVPRKYCPDVVHYIDTGWMNLAVSMMREANLYMYIGRPIFRPIHFGTTCFRLIHYVQS